MEQPTRTLHGLGQSLWLDNITRGMLGDGTLLGYREQKHVTGLTSNPTIFAQAIKTGKDYDASIRGIGNADPETVFFGLAIDDLRRAAAIFEPVYQQTHGVDGWVSLEVSPLLADDTQRTIEQAVTLHKQAAVHNLFIKVPGTPAGVPAIEELIFRGVPINVTLLFSPEQYQAAAEAWLRGLERRHEAGLDLDIASVASVFISRWDVKVADKVPADLRNKLGFAVCAQIYAKYRELINSPRVQRLQNAGARVQRLLWASTGTKDPNASDVMYIENLIAPLTVNTMPEKTLLAFADHGKAERLMTLEDPSVAGTLAQFQAHGIEVEPLAKVLQQEGADSFVKSWHELIDTVSERMGAVA
ncbi:transaldolase [Dyella nitratireducens]|uniref:Transaldolase n=1 Tax=Dyella nitratireducens TaxID=1849580 RepID=A0ABQ1FSE0_9GAMM|nr:transaldolase [Dyella nitratireducens]GGA28605.1 transaldolase [Dyella nitratireducens]GLQ43258.1 transaldolase [Dyella nitratireducens]